jgi:3-methyl-2-oxobutanoate hydroxymethyltransferase
LRREDTLAAEEARLEKMRAEAFKVFAVNETNGGYPETRHELHVTDEVLDAMAKSFEDNR